MKIAYCTSYVGREMFARFGKGKNFALSGSLKSLGLARAMMLAGHEVIIYSPGVTTFNTKIMGFTEFEEYPEGRLAIKYCNIISKRRCDPINQIRIARCLNKDHKTEHFDAVIFYNISLAAALSVSKLKGCMKILEYEDNIFNKALQGDKNEFEWFKRKLYNKVIGSIDGLMAVCNGLMLPQIKHKVLTPGIINEEVIGSISSRVNRLTEGKPVRIILTGGIHYSKGGDLLVKAMSHIKTPCIVSVYGNCNLDENLKKLVLEVPPCHRFEFNGYMPHGELMKTLERTADILINTTRSMGVGDQAAGFPFKMMEYAAMGRPIVSSEIGKLDEFFNQHVTYFKGEDPKMIANAVESVIAQYDLKVKSALELQQQVLQEYSIEGLAKRINRFLLDCKNV